MLYFIFYSVMIYFIKCLIAVYVYEDVGNLRNLGNFVYDGVMVIMVDIGW